jgi:hypothetical protein
MKLKRILAYLTVLTVLLALAVLLERPWKGKEAEESPLFPRFVPEAAARIELKGPEAEVILEKKAVEWQVASSANYPADAGSIENLLSKVKGLSVGSLVSKKPEKHPIFKVDESGLEVKVLTEDSTPTAQFFVGKTGPDRTSTYLRRGDSPEVYLVNERLESTFSRPEWRDLNIFRFNPNDVLELTLKPEGKKEISLKRNIVEGIWEIDKPFKSPANKEEVDSLLVTFSSLRAQEFAEEGALKKSRLARPQATFTAVLVDGSKKMLLVGRDKDKSLTYVKKEGDDTIFLVSQYQLRKLSPKPDDLKQEAEDEP